MIFSLECLSELRTSFLAPNSLLSTVAITDLWYLAFIVWLAGLISSVINIAYYGNYFDFGLDNETGSLHGSAVSWWQKRYSLTSGWDVDDFYLGENKLWPKRCPFWL